MEKVRVFSDRGNPVAEENFKRLMRAWQEGGESAMREEWNRIFPDDPVSPLREPIKSLQDLFAPKPAPALLESAPNPPKAS